MEAKTIDSPTLQVKIDFAKGRDVDVEQLLALGPMDIILELEG